MLLDEFMPQYDFGEYHQALAAAPAQRAFRAMQDLDMRQSRLVGALMLLRELPFRLRSREFKAQGMGRSLEQMQDFGFIQLGRQEPREMVLGLVGRFWSTRPLVRRVTPGEFRDFSQPGYAKVAANFLVEPLGPGLVRVSTETRVQCLGWRARSRFRGYWTLIRPFSGLIRREWLRLARQEAEGPRGGFMA
ncbi:MAG: hypothetical protein V1806_04495 [Pseudomonadota bacterium]